MAKIEKKAEDKVYPYFTFHKEHAPEGKLVKSEEDEPTGDGWVDTPAKFDPKYKDPPKPPTEPGSLPEEARRKGYVPKKYPSHRFHVDGKQERVVKTAEEDAELDPKVWKHSPDKNHWDKKEHGGSGPAAAPVAGDGKKGKKGKKGAAAEPSTPAASALPEDPTADVALDTKQIAAFYKSGIGDIVAQLEAVTNPKMVAALAAAEADHPKGPRAGVVKALKARAALLQAE